MTDKQPQLNMPIYDDMVKAGMHYGRKKTVFNPNMRPYIYTAKENIYILDLVKTTEALNKAAEFLKEAKKEGKVILFVGVTRQSSDLAKNTAIELGMPYMVDRWVGGALTNFKTIYERVKFMEELEKKLASSDAGESLTKKEKIKMERELAKVKEKFGGIRNMAKLPDIIFVTSLKEGQLPVREAKRVGIKTVGIVNTDSDPKQLDWPIPANDNARKSVELILNSIKNSLKS